MGLCNLIVIIGVAFVVVQSTEAQNVNLDPGSSIPCICPAHYIDPVCGTDFREYRNECYLICASRRNPSLRVYRRGRCNGVPIQSPVIPTQPPVLPVIVREPCICPAIYAPVCGSDGKSYSNECVLNCEKRYTVGLTVVKRGICEKAAAGIQTFSASKVREPCICTLEWAPICGSDGVTYSNKCALQCEQRYTIDLIMSKEGEC